MTTKFTEYLIKRVIQCLLVLFGLSILIFSISRILPGDPARLALGPEASEEEVERLRQLLGLHEPLHVQYINFISGLLRGDLGISILTWRNVLYDILDRLPASLELTTVALIFAVLVGVPIGIISGIKKDKAVDYLSRGTAMVGVSFPRFFVGILLQIFIYFFILKFVKWPISGRIGTTPPTRITGFYLIDSLLTCNLAAFISAVQYMVLPALSLALPSIAQIMRVTRNGVIEQLRKDYIIQAKALGLPDNLIQYKYILKNAFTSVLTIIGLLFGFQVGSAFMVETVFVWPGIGYYGVRAALMKDINAVVGVVLVLGLIYLIVNLTVDLLYGYLDPRIRYGEKAE